MRKRVWFVQQKPFGHMPLRAGLGLCTLEDLRERGIFYGTEAKEAILKTHQQTCGSLSDIGYRPELLCPKIFTTRTHRLKGKYQVVEGSRFKARPVEPAIRFTVNETWELDLRRAIVKLPDDRIAGWGWLDSGQMQAEFGPDRMGNLAFTNYTFPEIDLGFKGASFEMLRAELLRLNPKATIDTPFYVSWLEKPVIDDD